MHRADKRDLYISDIVKWCKSHAYLSASRMNRRVKDVWMDSRKIQSGDVFVALKGGDRDGHNYVSSALKAGAAAAIVDKGKVGMYTAGEKKKLVPTADPLAALQTTAKEYRKRLNIPVIGITGSNGKTTTRRFAASVLAERFNVSQSSGNWNNHIGVPLSLLRMKKSDHIGIVEMGANHEKEIELLSLTALPDIAVVTNIGYAHIGLFGSLENTAQAKLEIVRGMDKKNGLMLLNGDDAVLKKAASGLNLEKMFYGFSTACGFRAAGFSEDKQGNSVFVIDGSTYKVKMFAKHFIYNILPAVFLGRYFGMSHDEIQEIVKGLKPGIMRGRLRSKKGVCFIADYYNANPSSMKSAIDLLERSSKKRNRYAVVGDMLELGKYSSRLHRRVGEQLADAGVKRIIAVGAYSDKIAEGAVKRGMNSKRIDCVESVDKALPVARSNFKKGDVVLVKGSRAVNLEKLFNKF